MNTRLGATFGAPSSNGGSILLLAAVCALSMSLLALSFSASTSNMIEIARLETEAFRAEMLADSAIGHAEYQLILGQEFAANGPEWSPVGEHERIGFYRLEKGGDPQLIHLVADARVGEATIKREAVFRLIPDSEIFDAGPLYNKTIAVLGGDANIRSANIEGDILILDDPAYIYDFHYTDLAWEPATMDDPSILVDSVSISGLLHVTDKSTGPSYVKKVVIAKPIPIPHWELTTYLDPDPRSILLTTPNLNNLTVDETVVIKVPPGTKIRIKDCELRGGVVIYNDPAYDYRAAPLHEVWIENTIYGDGDKGLHPYLGFIAPSARIIEGNSLEAHGMLFVHSIEQVNSMEMWEAAIYVLNDIQDLSSFDVKSYASWLWSIPYPGLRLPETQVELLSVNEYYEDLETMLEGVGKGNGKGKGGRGKK